jgi:cob(I)alamin adenosyltransferase
MKARIYTKTGDKGHTSLVGGKRVPKNHRRLEAYGTLDELNSCLGMLRSGLSSKGLKDFDSKLQAIQNSLFNIGSHLACEDVGMQSHLPNLHSDRIGQLETDMDLWEKDLPALRNFILPGGSECASIAHLARTVCRRAERHCVGLTLETEGSDGSILVASDHIIYLNRLSDWLFVLSRKLNADLGIADIEWSKE